MDVDPAAAPVPTAPFPQLALSADLTGDGGPEMLVVDSLGNLFRRSYHPDYNFTAAAFISGGWTGRTLYAPGDWDGDGRADLFSTTPDGRLWLHKGMGSSTFAAAAQVGHGWTGFRIIPVGDLNADKRQDLLAIDSSGRLWMYAGLPGGLFAKRVQVGNGWTGYALHPGGDQNGDGRPDIFGISSGLLYFYAGTGPGKFAKRVQVGRGWGGVLFAAGHDFDRDGYVDLIGRRRDHQFYFYPGRGNGVFGAASADMTPWTPSWQGYVQPTGSVTRVSCVADGWGWHPIGEWAERWAVTLHWTLVGGNWRWQGDKVLRGPGQPLSQSTSMSLLAGPDPVAGSLGTANLHVQAVPMNWQPGTPWSVREFTISQMVELPEGACTGTHGPPPN